MQISKKIVKSTYKTELFTKVRTSSFCHSCRKQFIGDHALTYKAYHLQLENKIKKMLVQEKQLLSKKNFLKLHMMKKFLEYDKKVINSTIK